MNEEEEEQMILNEKLKFLRKNTDYVKLEAERKAYEKEIKILQDKNEEVMRKQGLMWMELEIEVNITSHKKD